MSGPIRISRPTSQIHKMYSIDPEGSIWVKVRPPGMTEETERAELTSARSRTVRNGQFVVQTHINELMLTVREIVLTFGESNIHVEVQDPDDPKKYIPVDLRGTRESLGRARIAEAVAQLPTEIINEWHSFVMDDVEAWRDPFGWTGSGPRGSAMRQ